MSYCQFNRQKILQKAKDKYSKEKAAEYYLKNKEAIKENSKNRYKNCQKKKKTRLKRKISAINSVQKEALQDK